MSIETLPSPSTIPLLRDGDRLSREEFERRYEQMPDTKAELLDGVVYLGSPVSETHGSPHAWLVGWAVYYEAFTPGVIAGDNVTARLPTGSNPQPDVCLRVLESAGGNSQRDNDGCISGSPELFAEIALSSLSIDRDIKRPLYQRNAVREYILWRVGDNAIDWYAVRGNEYELLTAGDDGIVRSEAFPGLWLDVEALLRGDMGSVMRVLQRGIESPEHAEFVQKLRTKGTT